MPKFALSLVTGLLTVATVALPATQTDVYDLTSSMKKGDDSIISLGKDGVLRSFGPNLMVLSYQKLSVPQIQTLINGYGRDDNLTKAFEGVNGHDVVDEKQCSHPDKSLIPAEFPFHLQPDISAIRARDDPPNDFSPPECHDEKCYGPGNCFEGCSGCFVPYPGYQGNCIK